MSTHPMYYYERDVSNSNAIVNKYFIPDNKSDATTKQQSIKSSSVSKNQSIISIAYNKVRIVFVQVFLPLGFPHTVRHEYLSYQFWDSIQCISSSIRHVMTTKYILLGAGVGNASSSAIAATISWACRDGVGMIGSLMFAYQCSNQFEIYTKEYRLLADVLNNIGLSLDLLCSIFPSNYYLLLISMSTLSKSCCGLVASATKARISAHFALNDHLADVTAKESTQETAVGLIGLCCGMAITNVLPPENDFIINTSIFLILLLIHLYANYMLISTLVFDTLNPQRLYLITQCILSNDNIDITPVSIQKLETLVRPLYLSNYGPIIGCSMMASLAYLNEYNNHIIKSDQSATSSSIVSFHDILHSWKDEAFFIVMTVGNRSVVCLHEGHKETDVIKAYMLSLYLSHHHVNNHDLVYQHHIIKNLIDWYREHIESSNILSEKGWEIDKGKTRLGELEWRYVSKSE